MKEVQGKHSTCPRCGSTDTFWNDSNADPDDSGSYFYMHCEGCDKVYISHMVPSYKTYDEDE